MVIHTGILTKMKAQSLCALLCALACAIGLGACAGPTDTAFPDLQSATTPDGTFPNTENLRMIAPGMTKRQVDDLIGPPHFRESVFRVRVWNYLFHFRDSEKRVTCRYQIQYDDHSRVSRTRWSEPQCERFAPAKIASGADTDTSGAKEKSP